MDNIDILISKFLSKQLSREEKKQLLAWLKENKNNQQHFKQIESLYHAAGIDSNRLNFDYENAFSQFQQKLAYQKNEKKTKLRYLLLSASSVAASIIITAFITITYFTGKEIVPGTIAEVSNLEITTSKGSKTSVTLSDGTEIWLNSSSKLVYPNRFTGKTREVFLEGEGYFEVNKNPNKPFYVKTNTIDVRVTGTTFNLKSYSDDSFVETTLIEGEVIIENTYGNKTKEVITLEPNQKVIFHKSEESFKLAEDSSEKKSAEKNPTQKIERAVLIEKANIEKSISWKNNIIIFENEPFYMIVNNLERRFGVDIVFQSESIKNLRFSGTFDEISIEQALEAMSFASPFKYSVEKDIIYITD